VAAVRRSSNRLLAAGQVIPIAERRSAVAAGRLRNTNGCGIKCAILRMRGATTGKPRPAAEDEEQKLGASAAAAIHPLLYGLVGSVQKREQNAVARSATVRELLLLLSDFLRAPGHVIQHYGGRWHQRRAQGGRFMYPEARGPLAGVRPTPLSRPV